MGLFRRKFPSVASIPDAWAVLKGERDGVPMLVRVASWAWDIRGHQDYPWRVGIAAPFASGRDYESANDPSTAHGAFEDRAIAAMSEGLLALPLVVITTPKFRELVFQAKDERMAAERARAICEEFEAIEAAAYMERDPSWEAFAELCGGKRPG